MCILFIATKQHPDYPVIICANRDEFHQRPSQKMHWWQSNNILAGKDLQAGGTWLGLNKAKQFSALTNYRQPLQFQPDKKSRGELVVNALTSATNEFKQQLSTTSTDYNGFNLIFGELDNLQVFDSVNNIYTNIDEGFHSICNGALDDIWPKMTLGVEQLKRLITQQTIDIEQLFLLLRDRQIAAKELLPATGLSTDLEELVSSIFITSPDYGTRSSVIILMNQQGNITIFERTYDNSGSVKSESDFTI